MSTAFLYQMIFGVGIPIASHGNLITALYSPSVSCLILFVKMGGSAKEKHS